MAKIPALTPREKELVQFAIDEVHRLRANEPLRGQDPEQDHQAPEMYIALPPSTGIPAISRSGTGTTGEPGQGDQPGSAVCDIYYIDEDGILQPVTGFNQTVYNLTGIAFPHDFVEIKRTKFGKWVASANHLNGILGEYLYGGEGTGTGDIPTGSVGTFREHYWDDSDVWTETDPAVDYSDVLNTSGVTMSVGLKAYVEYNVRSQKLVASPLEC